MAKKISDFSRGQGCMWKGDIWVFTKMEHVKPGKGPAYLQCELRNSKTQSLANNRFRPDEQLEPVHFDRKKMQYLYSDGSGHIMMDTETYDQITIPKEIIGDKDVFLQDGLEVEICIAENEIISAELPNTVEIKVLDVPPNVKGATATNQLKIAECEGGAVVKVPPFVENGQLIKVDTRTGEYLGRV